MGFLRLGFITIFLSDPLISGFTTGAACWVFTSQIKHIIAIYPERYSGPFALVKVRNVIDCSLLYDETILEAYILLEIQPLYMSK